MTRVSFPGLNIGWFDINPIAFSLFGIKVHWYGIIIAFGFALAVLYCTKNKQYGNLTSDNVLDIAIYGAPSGIICARIYYVVFSFADYKDNLWDVFKIWNGGIAIYGAVIGAVISTYIYCRVKKISVARAFDLCIMGVLIGQIIGRWGNFVNGEAHGGETDFILRMGLFENGREIFVHPTFLYESLWNVGVFLVLRRILKKRHFDGEVFLGYLALYSVGRFWIEGMRTDSLYLGGVRISQLLAAILAILSICAIIYNLKRKNCSEGTNL